MFRTLIRCFKWFFILPQLLLGVFFAWARWLCGGWTDYGLKGTYIFLCFILYAVASAITATALLETKKRLDKMREDIEEGRGLS